MEIVEVKILCECSLFEFDCEVSNVIKSFFNKQVESKKKITHRKNKRILSDNLSNLELAILPFQIYLYDRFIIRLLESTGWPLQ